MRRQAWHWPSGCTKSIKKRNCLALGVAPKIRVECVLQNHARECEAPTKKMMGLCWFNLFLGLFLCLVFFCSCCFVCLFVLFCLVLSSFVLLCFALFVCLFVGCLSLPAFFNETISYGRIFLCSWFLVNSLSS